MAYFPETGVSPDTLQRSEHTTRHQDLGFTSWYTVRAGEQSAPRGPWQHIVFFDESGPCCQDSPTTFPSDSADQPLIASYEVPDGVLDSLPGSQVAFDNRKMQYAGGRTFQNFTRGLLVAIAALAVCGMASALDKLDKKEQFTFSGLFPYPDMAELVR